MLYYPMNTVKYLKNAHVIIEFGQTSDHIPDISYFTRVVSYDGCDYELLSLTTGTYQDCIGAFSEYITKWLAVELGVNSH